MGHSMFEIISMRKNKNVTNVILFSKSLLAYISKI